MSGEKEYRNIHFPNIIGQPAINYINSSQFTISMTKTKILEKTNDSTVNIALDTINIQKQAIIFVNTKRGAESTAEKIAAKSVSNDKTLEV
jgi:replicative superfamily II helicase